MTCGADQWSPPSRVTENIVGDDCAIVACGAAVPCGSGRRAAGLTVAAAPGTSMKRSQIAYAVSGWLGSAKTSSLSSVGLQLTPDPTLALISRVSRHVRPPSNERAAAMPLGTHVPNGPSNTTAMA